MAKNFNLDLEIFKSDLNNILNQAQVLKVKPVNPALIRTGQIQWTMGDLEEETILTFTGPKKALVELAFFTHGLYGGGFSFSDEDVLDCIY